MIKQTIVIEVHTFKILSQKADNQFHIYVQKLRFIL